MLYFPPFSLPAFPFVYLAFKGLLLASASEILARPISQTINQSINQCKMTWNFFYVALVHGRNVSSQLGEASTS